MLDLSKPEAMAMIALIDIVKNGHGGLININNCGLFDSARDKLKSHLESDISDAEEENRKG